MSYAPGYPADPLTDDDLLHRIIEDAERGVQGVPEYLTAQDVRGMALDLQRLRYAQRHPEDQSHGG